ncbi:MAG: hypothetical protein U0736_25745, partial [Gemmataceae bacterium]
MRPFTGFAWGVALATLVAGGGPAHAAWNNVFQVCCSSCGSAPAPAVAAYTPAVAAYTPAVVAPAPVVAAYGAADGCCEQPPPTCTTRYVQRSCYTPVTTYRTSQYYEPVTTYRTSYYYEPVTCYRYSCYYDPCTCGYQRVATPVTSYQLRSRCCPVTSYLQRTCTTPVTSYQQSFYYEPVTSCCTPTSAAACTPAAPNTRVTPAPAVPAPPPSTSTTTVPEATESAAPAAPATAESREPFPAASSDSYKPRTPSLAVPPPGTMPRAQDSSYRAPAQRPPVRYDRIASRGEQTLHGTVVDAARAPRAGARVLLVSAEAKNDQHTVRANDAGAFNASVT